MCRPSKGLDSLGEMRGIQSISALPVCFGLRCNASCADVHVGWIWHYKLHILRELLIYLAIVSGLHACQVVVIHNTTPHLPWPTARIKDESPEKKGCSMLFTIDLTHAVAPASPFNTIWSATRDWL